MSSAPNDVLHLLRQRGRQPDPAALDSLMRGVAAAPEGLAGPEWVELIDPTGAKEETADSYRGQATLETKLASSGTYILVVGGRSTGPYMVTLSIR